MLERALLLLGCFFFLCGAAAAPAAEWGLEQLMGRLRDVKSVKARFVERKHLAILKTPLESSGTLVYTAPGRLEKHTVRPKPEHLVLERDRLIFESGDKGKPRTIVLQQYPVIWAFVESFRSTLAGDLQTLNRFYKVRLLGAEGGWLLVLNPIQPAMQEVVSEIRVAGSAQRIQSIEIFEAGGDRSMMTITEEPR